MARDFSRYTRTPNVPALRLIKAQEPTKAGDPPADLVHDPFGVMPDFVWQDDIPYPIDPEGVDCDNPFTACG